MERIEHHDWNDGWAFTPRYDPALLGPDDGGPAFAALAPVRLPHTVKVLPFNYCNENDYQLVSGYRRVFTAPKSWEGRTLLLTFGAAAHDAVVYCNGQRVGHHACGYTAFTVNLTGAVRLGDENILVVRCDSRETLDIPPFGGQTEPLTYGGLYRGVALEVKENAWLRDVFIQAGAEGDFRIYSAAEGETVGCALEAEIRAPSGRRAVYMGELSLPISGTLNGVQPWSCEHPTLYTLTLRLIRPGSNGLPDRVLDQKVVRFGFRTLQFVAGGLYLNGSRVGLRGLARGQSWPYQGYAMPDSLQRLDAQILKRELGCNAVRCTCPPSPAFLDACDEQGLLAFVEMPGGAHVGGPAWKAQALQNCREMVCQCRNHPSVFLWGVRSAGALDDEAFYRKTSEAARRLDPTRPTAGVHRNKKGQLLEDVYAYDDYSFTGAGPGCLPRATVTPDLRKGYLISAYGGMMYPTKSFDATAQRLSQALRCAAVLNDAAAQQGVAGSFGWCMTDYNTHPAYGSGDRVSYQGVMDLFRNPKLAAALYASQKTPRIPSDIVLEVSPAAAFGDMPAGLPGGCWAFTNADAVRMYRDGDFIAEFTPDRQGRFAALDHPPIQIDDFVGPLLEKYEGIAHGEAVQLAACLNALRRDPAAPSPLLRARLTRLLRTLRMNEATLIRLYHTYIGVLGGPTVSCRFEAVWRGRVARTLVQEPAQRVRLECTVRNGILTDGPTWDCAAVVLRAIDQNGRLLPYCSEAVRLSVEGPARLLGPAVVPLRGGMAGAYLATEGVAGRATLHCQMEGALDTEASILIRRREN